MGERGEGGGDGDGDEGESGAVWWVCNERRGEERGGLGEKGGGRNGVPFVESFWRRQFKAGSSLCSSSSTQRRGLLSSYLNCFFVLGGTISDIGLTTEAWSLRFFSRALSRWLPRAMMGGNRMSAISKLFWSLVVGIDGLGDGAVRLANKVQYSYSITHKADDRGCNTKL